MDNGCGFMDQNKTGEFIKKLRTENHLTQKEFANKYGVTYQAVSKWENGKNLPDMSLLKQMSEDFNIGIDEFLDGEKKPNRKMDYKYLKSAIIGISIIVLMFIIMLLGNNDTYEFKTLSTKCNNFNISGTISYNDKKSSIFINKITYCGGDDINIYKNIECILYEKEKDIDKQIATYSHNSITPTKLEDFLENALFTVDNYSRLCKEFKENSLYLKIKAVTIEGKYITYEIPLTLSSNCKCKAK